MKLLLSSVKEILGDEFLGMYLYGSLSSGDFDPKSSDIDFLVVTSSILPEEAISALEGLHEHIWASGLKWAAKLEGSYVPKSLIRRHDPKGPACPTINEGRFFIDKCGSDWIIQRHIIREYGVVVEGPDPKTLIDSVTSDDIRRAIIGILNEWWFPMLNDPTWLRERGGIYHAFAVLTMCRALFAMEYGTIASKPAAAKWAVDELGETWRLLIEKALATQHGNNRGYLNETMDFIRYTHGRLSGIKIG